MKNKCKMTISSKHMWHEIVEKFGKDLEGNYDMLISVTKCIACGLIDDRKSREKNMKFTAL